MTVISFRRQSFCRHRGQNLPTMCCIETCIKSTLGAGSWRSAPFWAALLFCCYAKRA